MKKFYNSFLRSLCYFPTKIEYLKTFFSEWYAIFRKKNLYKNIQWTKDQQREFDAFWKKNYGKKISNRWHKLYQSMNGVHRIDYIPEIIYTTRIEHSANDYFYGKVLSDKAFLGVMFDNRIPKVRTPKTYISNSYGVFYDSERKIISECEAKEMICNIGEAVAKPTIDSSSGKNIKILDVHNGINIKDGMTISEIFNIYGSNFIIQEKIEPHSELKKIYPEAVNTFRVTSYILNANVYLAPISLRIGSGGSVVDNIHSGGMGVAVNEDGTLHATAYLLGNGDKSDKATRHPDTGIVFQNVKFSFIDKIILAAKHLHGIVSNTGVISWDFTIDKNGDIVIIEVNLKGQGIWLPQIISGESLFGENTIEYLRQMKKKVER
ncbi:MAG: hypothetical protein E7434_05475 [Ruminococcaceae bacterium]|nr:hypothetical protein [Oscillospiraceae bacterium]